MISYYGVYDDASSNLKDFTILLNRYIAVCTLVLIFHSICNMIFLGINKDSILLIILSIFIATFSTNFDSFRKNKYVISAVLLILNIVVTYYSSFCGIESGIYLFYFILLTCLPVFFDISKDRNIMILLICVIIFSLYLSALTNFTLIKKNPFIGTYTHKLLILNITCVLLLFSVNFFFLLEKKEDYYFILNRSMMKHQQIADLKREVERMKALLSRDDFSDHNIEELLNAITLNDVLFIEKFERFFPDFFIKLNKLSSVTLNVTDLKFCAMLKLGFTTKQIAVYTSSSIKAVESKKYRLRKKLGITVDSTSTNWMSSI